MVELKKTNQLESDFVLINLNGEVCTTLLACMPFTCGCDGPEGNSSINDNDEIIF
jgi:hypothetical protein